jgi:hypothetical protein
MSGISVHVSTVSWSVYWSLWVEEASHHWENMLDVVISDVKPEGPFQQFGSLNNAKTNNFYFREWWWYKLRRWIRFRRPFISVDNCSPSMGVARCKLWTSVKHVVQITLHSLDGGCLEWHKTQYPRSLSAQTDGCICVEKVLLGSTGWNM